VLILGFLIAAVSGYMAGLIGASNSPISGLGILSVVSGSALLLVAIRPDASTRPGVIAFALFVTAVVIACATISNDNLQDLKTGQLVGASPRRQQIALIVGVLAGAVVIPPILHLLAKSYGFAGAPNVGVISNKPLDAPQANLISALARGVVGGDLNTRMLGVGLIVGACLITIDELLGLRKLLRIPPLAIGIGIYLPMSSTFAVVVGSIVGHWYNRRVKGSPQASRLEQLGVLVASGLIVGESLFGVLQSGLIVASGSDAPLGLVPESFFAANYLGALAFIVLIVVLYRWMLGRGDPPEARAARSLSSGARARGEHQGERGALADARAVCADRAAHLGHRTGAGMESEAMARGLGREAVPEQPVAVLRRDPGAVVANAQVRLARRVAADLDRDLSIGVGPLRHRLDRVLDQIHDHVGELGAVHHHRADRS